MEKAVHFKHLLTRLGSRLPMKVIHELNATVNYLEVGRWMRASGFSIPRRVKHRNQLFELVGGQVSDREVLYLEFGVFQGAATRKWSSLLRNPNCKLHGFDSFEGLPESWVRPKDDFKAHGNSPQIDDPRVTFFKGWFDQTVPGYKVPPHDVLVMIMDADLYSSTNFVLSALEDAITPGTYLYFDEFNHRFDELRAFDEFLNRTRMKFSVVGATHSLAHVMFQRCYSNS